MPPPETDREGRKAPEQRITLEYGPRTPEWERAAALILRKLAEHAQRQQAS